MLVAEISNIVRDQIQRGWSCLRCNFKCIL